MSLPSNDDGSLRPEEGKGLPQFIVVSLVTLSAFSIGTYLSWTSSALPLYNRNDTLAVNDQEGSWICALIPLGAIAGTIPAGIVADNIGRKITTFLTTLPLFLCWFVIGFANSKTWIYLGRYVAGAACGAASVVVPMYVSEIVDTSIRGSLGTIFQLQISLGILYAYGTGFTDNLQLVSLLCAVVPGFLLIVFPFMPESPVWLIAKDRKNEAMPAIRRLKGRDFMVERELTRLESTREVRGLRPGILELVYNRKATVITLGLMTIQQLSGVNTLIFYAKRIFEEAGFVLSATVCSVIVGAVQVIATYFSTILIERTGRKFLLFVSSSVMAICMFLLSGYFHFQNSRDVSNVTWLPLLSFTVFIVVFSVGFGPIPWLMVGELFSNDTKSAASSATAICNWLLAFLVTKCFQDMTDLMGISLTFAVFGTIDLLGTVFVSLLVPETTGKSTIEVQHELYGTSNRDEEFF